MPTPGIVELTDDQMVVQHSNLKWRSVKRSITVPVSLSGKYVNAVGVVSNVALTDAQEAALETAIEAITGVNLAKILVGSSRLSQDGLPTDTAENTYSLDVLIAMAMNAVETPVEVP